MKARAFAIGSLLLALSLASVASADWPVARHDARRTAIASGASSIKQPTGYWSTYTGGSLSASAHVALDVNGDGTTEIVYVAGGKVLAKLPDDRLVWESPPVEITTLHAVVDLDGDGVLEVVASSPRNVFVLSGATGAILWSEPEGEVGNVGGVRLADLDGDKHPEIVIDDCACCGISATASPPGGIYKFAKPSSPTKLGTPLTRGHCGSEAVTVGDFDADGADDVAYGDPTGYQVVSGKTSTASVSAAVGNSLYYSHCSAANVDAKPGDELICFQDVYLASTSSGGRVLAVLGYDAAATPPLKTLWKLAPVPLATGRLVSVGNSVVDLDGDGRLEIVVAWSSDGAKFDTSIYDAKLGTVLGTITGENLAAIVDLDGDKKPEVLTHGASGLVARRFERGATPAVTSYTTLASDLSVPSQLDWSRAARSSAQSVPITIDLAGDGKVVPVLFSSSGKYQATRFSADASSITPVATFTVPAGVSILTNQVFGKVNRDYPQLLLTRNDGYLLVLDSAFAPTNALTLGTGEFKTTLPGMRVGGFVAAPIAPRLGGTNDAVIVTDSRGVLQRLDASAAWMSKGPTVSWEVAGGHAPTTAKSLGGAPGLFCGRGANVTALDAAGKTLWEKPMPSGGAVFADPLAADVNGDGTSDAITAYQTAGSVMNVQAFDGKTGAPMWPSPVSEAMSWGFYPFSLADWNGDGVDDVFMVLNTLRAHDGKTGSKLAQNTNFLAYFTPVLDDVDGDGAIDVTMSRGYYPARTYKKDLVTALWTGADDDRPYQHGARAACGARNVWIQPSSQNRGLVRLFTMSGADAGKATALWLAGGKAFGSAADAKTAGVFVGTLGDVAVKSDLVGGGDHPSALVGSSDGFLYAFDPCKSALDWAYDLKFAVGDPILADTNGDGVDEILVGAADGYLRAIGPRVLDAPTMVNDNDPLGMTPGPDVDTIAVTDRAAGSWNAVAGADGYQVAVLTEGGTYVSQPDWVDVGAVTNAIVKGISLSVGKKYFFAVRAVSKTKGSSLETRSNGVTILMPTAPDGGTLGDAMLEDDAGTSGGSDAAAGDTPTGDGAAGGCGCQVPAHGRSSGALGLALAMLLFGRRCSRARSS